jgi:hypothetical protein
MPRQHRKLTDRASQMGHRDHATIRKQTMALFQKSPEKTLQRDRDTALANRDRLAISLTASEDNVILAKKRVQRCAIEGEDAGLDGAEQAEVAALRRLTTITAAHAEAEQILTKLDGQIAAASEKTVRAATAQEANTMADELLQVAKTFDVAIGQLANISNRATSIVFEASGLSNFATSSRTEVPQAAEIVAALLRDHAAAVIDGSAPAVLPTPEKPFTPTIAPKPVTRPLFTLRSISWTNADGMLRVAQRYTDADLPLDAADRAIKARVCVEMTDPARNQSTHNQWPGHPDPAQCYSLDGAVSADVIEEDHQHDVVKHSGFVETVGKPYIVRTAAGVA